MSQATIFDTTGKKTDTIELPKDIFDGKVNTAIIHQAIVQYQANLRQGTVSTKGHAEVSGGGKKPWRQKGTGRARQGSTRSPLWVGGGVVFGPKPRDFSYSIPRKIRRLALKESLKAKHEHKSLVFIVDIKQPFEKTKEFAKILKALKLQGKTLAVLEGSNPTITRVSRNIRAFNLMRAQDVNAYDILRSKNLLLSKSAFEFLVERIKK
jgi:large subunit ribosomal protein L4